MTLILTFSLREKEFAFSPWERRTRSASEGIERGWEAN
jgi:hypothetical protein